ncbi:hypothetical protein FOS14_24120 [Skermania sp. ID1734]|uniref:FAS1-like dehydratase domain-containing protein n=1 Tax=Skermania sp. ID1734 TaxID=2597516 RepID=UPI00117C2F98|nr:MaoC family dehydratase N-terminal domain-containing protein [Skermania sp. ID1734]TSD92965.1 hypothetical protein FOS14_24120 [Skermania sp. ID1734]
MQDWKPHTVTTHETLDATPVAALAALFDDGLPTPAPGDRLPPMWHWVALPQWPVSSQIGIDGHPVRGTFLPPVELPRRMFAGGEVSWHGDLCVGEQVRRESRVESVTEKTGKSGRLVIVDLRIRLYGSDDRLAVEERQNLIYRAAGTVDSAPDIEPAAALAPVGSPIVRVDESTWKFATDPTLLMRFSAATANAHRIHYDWPYATRVEGYPGLVVHGPLMTLALAEVRRLSGWTGTLTRLRHRNLAPLFCGQPAQLQAQRCTDGYTVELVGADSRARTRVELQLS